MIEWKTGKSIQTLPGEDAARRRKPDFAGEDMAGEQSRIRTEKGMTRDRVRMSTGKGRNGQKAEETADEGEAERLRAREKGVYYLQFSSKTEEEMRRKLAGQGFSPASVDYAVGYLKERRYLNDEDYARRYVEKNGKRKSERQIRYDLSQKGISSEILDLVLEENPVDELEQILALLEKRGYPKEEANEEETRKQYAYLARRGFSCGDIRAAFEHYARKR